MTNWKKNSVIVDQAMSAKHIHHHFEDLLNKTKLKVRERIDVPSYQTDTSPSRKDKGKDTMKLKLPS